MNRYFLASAVLFLVSSLCYQSAEGQTVLTHGEPCDETTRCDKDARLLCGTDFTCACSSGPLTSTINFDLVWNAESKACLGVMNSACIGTADDAVQETDDFKAVVCGPGLSCEQEPGLPLSVGVCKTSSDSGAASLGFGFLTFVAILMLSVV
jgi:hypothetical protein